jgi:hypothetical protein
MLEEINCGFTDHVVDLRIFSTCADGPNLVVEEIVYGIFLDLGDAMFEAVLYYEARADR